MFRTKKIPLDYVAPEVRTALQRSFSDEELNELVGLATIVEIAEGSALTTQDDRGREVVIIVTGTASVLRDGEEIAQVGPGDIVGEMSVLTGKPRNATVTANEPMTAYALSKLEFATLLNRSPKLHNKVAITAVKRLAAA